MNNDIHSTLNPKLRRLLHCLSMAGTYMMLFGIIYSIQQFTVGLTQFFWDLDIKGIPVLSVLFIFTTIYILKKFFKISSPYKED
jgi:hypothetical protein